MSIYVVDKELSFPPVGLADEDGLLAIGGDLSVERLLLAYRQGIFPWYEGEHILWWSPDPRFVLFPRDLKVSKSMQQVIRKEVFTFTIDRDFRRVIRHCKTVGSKGQEGTWISDAMSQAYIRLHELGYAHSAEAWQDDQLVGGLYGIKIGNLFFGESMFSTVSNASKFAFIRYVKHLQGEGLYLVDCQVYTAHLESLGAAMIERQQFIRILNDHLATTE